jgi:uncharacterized protein YndB with AHSA1/START domain
MTVSSRSATVTLPTEDQILITREFDAPKHLVYRAYTDPELVRRWWHANRGEMTACEIDLRVGGKWRYAMIAHEGGFEVAFHGEYRELVPNERIVSTEVFEGAPPMEGADQGTLNTATFAESDGRTKLTVLVQAPNKHVRDAIIESGMEDGMQDALDLLGQIAGSLR